MGSVLWQNAFRFTATQVSYDYKRCKRNRCLFLSPLLNEFMAHVPIFQCKDTLKDWISKIYRLKNWHVSQFFSLKTLPSTCRSTYSQYGTVIVALSHVTCHTNRFQKTAFFILFFYYIYIIYNIYIVIFFCLLIDIASCDMWHVTLPSNTAVISVINDAAKASIYLQKNSYK